MFAPPGVAKAHESADGGWSGIKARDAVVPNKLPLRVWVRRTTLMHENGGTAKQRAVDKIEMAGNPARISGTPPVVLLLDIKALLESDVGASLVATVGVNGSLQFAGGTRGAGDEQWILKFT